MSIEDSEKLLVFTRLSLEKTPREISDELGIKYPTVLAMRKEFKEAQLNGTIHSLLNIDKAVVQRIAEEVQEEIQNLVPEEHREVESEFIAKEIQEITNDIDGYNILSNKLQTVALQVSECISDMLKAEVSVGQIESLVNSLTKLQVAFFSKQTAIINNNINNQHNNTQVNKFQGFLKP